MDNQGGTMDSDDDEQGFGTVELDGRFPPEGRYFLVLAEEPEGWVRADPGKHLLYMSMNELISQNNLRVSEYYARIIAEGGDIGAVQVRSIEDCVKDTRQAYSVAEYVRNCSATADPRDENPAIAFGERRKAQGLKNREAFLAANKTVDSVVHLDDEFLQKDAVDWYKLISKPLPPPPPHKGTPIMPGEFTKFPVFPDRRRGMAAQEIANAIVPKQFGVPGKETGPRHKKDKPRLETPGRRTSEELLVLHDPPFSRPKGQRTKRTSDDAGLGTDTTDVAIFGGAGSQTPGLASLKEPKAGTGTAELTQDSPRYGTWADLAGNLPKSIPMVHLSQTPMTPRQKRMLEEHRSRSGPKKPYVPLAERGSPSKPEKTPQHVLLARGRTEGFSPLKLDTESMPSMFTPQKERTQPRSYKNSLGQPSNSRYHSDVPPGEPSTPTKKSSQADPLSSFPQEHAGNSLTESLHALDDQPKQSMGPPKFYTHKRNHGLSKSSPQPRNLQRQQSVVSKQTATHFEEPFIDTARADQVARIGKLVASMHFSDNVSDRSSKGSFQFTKEQEDALIAGSFIQSPPPVPDKSAARNLQTVGLPQAEHKLKRVESYRNLSPQKKTSTDTIGRKKGLGLAKSVTTFNLNMAAPVPSGLPRSESVPGNLQEASANIFDVPDMPTALALPLYRREEASLMTPIREIEEIAAQSSEPGHSDILQTDGTADAKDLNEATKSGPQTESPSKTKRVVDSMQMFRPSFWNKDEAASLSKKNGSSSLSSQGKDVAQNAKKSEFEEKRPFVKVMWANMKSKVHQPKPTAAASGPNNLAPSGFMVSCDPTFQHGLYSGLELCLTTIANRYLTDEYNQGRISRSQATKYVQRWVDMGRAQFTEWNCGQLYQSQIIWALKDNLIFFGTYNRPLRDATLSNWETNAKEMAVRSGCTGDSAIQKHFQDSWKVLELLGAQWDDFVALSKLHMSFHQMVGAKKKANDAAGIPHEWSPAPLPKTPAPGSLVRTPMMK